MNGICNCINVVHCKLPAVIEKLKVQRFESAALDGVNEWLRIGGQEAKERALPGSRTQIVILIGIIGRLWMG